MQSIVARHTVQIGRVRIDLVIEAAFWTSLEEIAQAEKITTSELVARIVGRRQGVSASSALRVYILDYFMTRAQIGEVSPGAETRWLN